MGRSISDDEIRADLSACLRCRGHALELYELTDLQHGALVVARCLECELFMGCLDPTQTVTAAVETWNSAAAILAEHVRVAEAIRGCSHLYRELF